MDDTQEPTGIERLIAQIENVLGETQEGVPIHLIRRVQPEGDAIWIEKITRYGAAIERLAPPRTTYRRMCEDILARHQPPDNSRKTAEALKAVLMALREDLVERHLASTEEIIHGDLLTDMLEMAGRLINDGFKDPGAVVAGAVIAEQLRRLCIKHGVEQFTEYEGSRAPKRLADMNADLVAAGVYTAVEERNVHAWNEIRILAFRGANDQFTREQTTNMVSGIRHFIARFPA